MSYKVLVLDIDGTVTNSNKKVTPKTKEAIMKLQEDGIIVVVASGRPTYGVLPLAKELRLDEYGGYILSFNGGKIINCTTKEVVFEKILPENYLGKLADLAKENDCEMMSYDGNCVITTNPIDPFIEIEAKINKLPIKNIASFHKYDKIPVNKCIVTAEDEHLAEVEKLFVKEFGQELSIFRSEPFFLEIMPKDIDKAFSLEKLLEYLNYKKEEMVACGDGFNDLSMIKFAGMGVAMENAQQVVKDAADFITKSNDEDGVAFAIEQLFQSKNYKI